LFEDVFDNSEARAEFKVHLVKTKNDENIIFYELVDEFKRLKSIRNRYALAGHIHDNFIKEQSDYELNLPSDMRNTTLEDFRNISSDTCPSTLFDDVQDYIFHVRLDSHPLTTIAHEIRLF
jgi:hypothetical protein